MIDHQSPRLKRRSAKDDLEHLFPSGLQKPEIPIVRRSSAAEPAHAWRGKRYARFHRAPSHHLAAVFTGRVPNFPDYVRSNRTSDDVGTLTFHCFSLRLMSERLRQWWGEEGLIAVIVLAICIPLMLLAVGSGGLKQNSIGQMYNPNRSFRPI